MKSAKYYSPAKEIVYIWNEEPSGETKQLKHLRH
jgi:hypothetical protein